MTYSRFPIADFGTGLFSAKEIWLAPPDAFEKLENARIDRGVIQKRPGYETMAYFPNRIGAITSLDDTVSPVEVTFNSHGLSDGDVVILQSMSGWTDGNNVKYVVTGATTNTFELLDSTGTSAYTSGGTIDHIEGLTYLGDITALTQVSVDDSDVDTKPVVTLDAAHGLSDDDTVLISGDFGVPIVGMDEINNSVSTIKVGGTDTFTLEQVNNKNYTAYTSGGYALQVNKVSGNAIMGIQELYKDEADNSLIVNSEDRTARYDESLGNLVAVSTSDDWTGSNKQLFKMTNGMNPSSNSPLLWMSNFTDRVKTTNGSEGIVADVDFATANSGNTVSKARAAFPFDNRMMIVNTNESGQFAQRVRWSRQNYAAGDTSQWDETASDSTAAASDAATEEEIIDIGPLGDDMIVFFERSIWALRKTGSPDLPVRWQKLSDAPNVFDSPFTTAAHDRFRWCLARHGLVATDGIQTVEIDDKITEWHRRINDGNFPIAFGTKVFQEESYWLSYADGDATRNDSVLAYNYKDQTFAEYTFGFNCAGEYTVADKPSVTWAEADTYSWGQLQEKYETWGDFYSGRRSVDNVFGDDTGRIYRLGGRPDDDGAIIPVTVRTARLNPFKEQGMAAQLGYVDVLFSRDDDTQVRAEFSVDFDPTPLVRHEVNLTPESTYASVKSGGIEKIWKRLYVNLIGDTHQIEFTCNEQSSKFEIHAIVLSARPVKSMVYV